MANIADGYICIESKNSDLLTDLKTQIKEKSRCFSYGGPVDIMEGEIDGLPYIEALFSGRWSCEDAWIFFEQLFNSLFGDSFRNIISTHGSLNKLSGDLFRNFGG